MYLFGCNLIKNIPKLIILIHFTIRSERLSDFGFISLVIPNFCFFGNIMTTIGKSIFLSEPSRIQPRINDTYYMNNDKT